jgi:hypothetical protein
VADRLNVRTGKTRRTATWKKAGARKNTLFDLTRQNELAEENREHRYKYTEGKREDG